MFLRVVDTIIDQEKVTENIDDENRIDGELLSDINEEEFPSVHGEPLCGESDR